MWAKLFLIDISTLTFNFSTQISCFCRTELCNNGDIIEYVLRVFIYCTYLSFWIIAQSVLSSIIFSSIQNEMTRFFFSTSFLTVTLGLNCTLLCRKALESKCFHPNNKPKVLHIDVVPALLVILCGLPGNPHFVWDWLFILSALMSPFWYKHALYS